MASGRRRQPCRALVCAPDRLGTISARSTSAGLAGLTGAPKWSHTRTRHHVIEGDKRLVPPRDMLRELMADNKAFAANLRDAHKIADDNEDVGTTSLLETFVDEAERRTWFLFEAAQWVDR
jgi:Ferritin-like domain